MAVSGPSGGTGGGAFTDPEGWFAALEVGCRVSVVQREKRPVLIVIDQ